MPRGDNRKRLARRNRARVFRFIVSHPGCSRGEVAAGTELHPATSRGHVNALIEEGRVDWDWLDEPDAVVLQRLWEK